MLDTLYFILVVIVFFGLVLHAIHQEERRKTDRRQEDRPVAVERRIGDRRGNSALAYLAWGLRTRWRRLTR
ncbi:hypothetical protein [Geothrix sp. 21YS21S-2]|uniref:hypothetical protein n=1 Tax=Geothrix sp. 21YS21S-2 TaxID=3068893 RepID=UPI0027B8DE0E|nr:hypothetical protein [Geothrix sp. 21YS21S-2]